MDLSPEERKKIKKAKLSKTLAGQKLSKEAILNRMSSGKKHPKSEARIKKERMKTPSKEDLVAKRLLFDGDDDDDNNKESEMDLYQSPAKGKSKLRGDSVTKKSSSTKKLASSTSKWQVSEGKPSSAKKQKVVEEQVETDSTKSRKKKMKLTKEEVDDEDVEDEEIDFPILKRKSLGMGEFKETLSSKKSPQKEQKMTRESFENGQSKKEKTVKDISENGRNEKKRKKKKVEEEGMALEERSANRNARGEKGKKNRNKKRGKKRKRSNSESEEPQAKKEKHDEALAVRCGNLPVGVGRSALRMFIGEADIFPSRIVFKKKKKSGAGGKKPFVSYATVFCSSASEAKKLCNLNGISMPSPVGNTECKLLIHMMHDNINQDPILKRKLFVSNLHPKIKEDELMEFFESGNFNPTNVILPKKGNDKTRGYAFVWVNSAGDADRALRLKNPSLRDKTFTIARSNRHPTNQEP